MVNLIKSFSLHVIKKLSYSFFLFFSVAGISSATTCVEVEFVAKYSMMLYRQASKPLSEAIDRFSVGEKEEADLYKKIVIDAYDQPLFTVDEYKQIQSAEFSNKWYSACLKSGIEK
ncbi:hypothetical protein [Vibrio anguillarum]|uniref:hypothetical protein n=1 Tax=Vibrio anguillarum TaxID=55601 RepID=UPI00097E330C|nr:hypothetical protein [Vibrio anguillarum]MBT2965626.1 hypothetical protein [Vibrio anguillarum]